MEKGRVASNFKKCAEFAEALESKDYEFVGTLGERIQYSKTIEDGSIVIVSIIPIVVNTSFISIEIIPAGRSPIRTYTATKITEIP